MVQNKIKVLRAGVGISQSALAEKMPDGANKVTMNFIEAGRCLPTKDGLKTMCEVFACKPQDIYSLDEIDLTSVVSRQELPQQKGSVPERAPNAPDSIESKITSLFTQGEGDGHEGMVQVRVWFKVAEKLALVKAVKGLGYHSLAEWLRDMYRQTINRYIELKIADNITSDTLGNTTSTTPSVNGNQMV